MGKKKKPEDQKDENLDKKNQPDDTNDSEDSFGLPDIEYKTLEDTTSEEGKDAEPSEEESKPAEASTPTYVPDENRPVYTPPEEEKSKAPLIIGIVIAIVIVLAAFLVYNYVIKPQQEKERQEQLAKLEREKKEKADREAARIAQEREDARKKAIADSIAAANAKPAVGTIETLTERTRRYYVVISSGIDDDLVMDYAKKLIAKGVSIQIIPPYGKYKFYRLTIANHDSFAAAQTNADAVKEQYGGNVWVLRY